MAKTTTPPQPKDKVAQIYDLMQSLNAEEALAFCTGIYGDILLYNITQGVPAPQPELTPENK